MAWLQAPEQVPSLEPERAPEQGLQPAPAWAPGLEPPWVPELARQLAPEQAQGRAPERARLPQSKAPGSSAALRRLMRVHPRAGCTGPGTA